ncbi:MAG: hypothetical protein J7K87_01995, partial [Candidatus Aenigmarchaeota archaeon]|nr:hypothetical protein [Candidatus Aenigmarchaeota archaeon]
MKKIKKLLIETDVDRLLELVDKNNEISTEEASKILNLPESIIEEWAEILSQNNMIEIKYELGGTTLKSVEFSEERKKKNLKRMKKENERLVKKGKELEDYIEKIEMDLSNTERFVNDFEKNIKEGMREVEKYSRYLKNGKRKNMLKEKTKLKKSK